MKLTREMAVRSGLCPDAAKHYLGVDEVNLEDVAETNPSWAIHQLRSLPAHLRAWKLFTIWCAEQVISTMEDPRSTKAVEVAKAFVLGKATLRDLEGAQGAAAAAADAAYAAADAAPYAAAAAYAAASYAACAAAYAASAAASYAASAAAYAAVVDSAEAREAQKIELIRVIKAIDTGQDPYPQ